MITCLNCEHQFNSPFCPQCGQKASTGRITYQSLLSGVVNSFVKIEKGLIYTFKQLSIAPHKTINGYVKGRRKNIFHPLSYMIIASSFYILAGQYIGQEPMRSLEKTGMSYQNNFDEKPALGKASYTVGLYFGRYTKYIWIFMVPALSLVTVLFFGKYNYPEHLTINSFIMGHSTLFGILIEPIAYWFTIGNPVIFLGASFLLYQAFRDHEEPATVGLLSIISLLLGYLVFLIVPIVLIYLYYLVI